MNQVVTSPDVLTPAAPFAPAMLATGSQTLWISGQVAQGPDGEQVGRDDVAEQARQCLRNIDALLRAAGATRTDVVRIVVFLTDMGDRASVAEARTEYFGDHKPTSTLVEVSALVAPEFAVEIEATAVF
jgi:2-iminobutanoate/2-iminopropanoate deaminase